MNTSKIPSSLRTIDYEAIESALMESARGRWFLAEFGRRNKAADTHVLLEAITKLESAVLRPRGAANADLIRRDLIEMSEAISRTRQEIAAIKSPDEQESQLITATEELDAIVASTEKATSDILEAAEDIQETAWLLRESGTEDEACDRLDHRATDIYTACSFQDITGQRTQKVVHALHFLESRVNSMIDIWGLKDIAPQRIAGSDERPDAHLLNGPQIDGRGLGQGDIDVMISRPDVDIEVIDAGAEPAPLQPEPAAVETAAENEIDSASPETVAPATDDPDAGSVPAELEVDQAPEEAVCLETPPLDVHPPAAAPETDAVPGPAIATPELETAAVDPAPVIAPEPALDTAEIADEEEADPVATSLDIDQSTASPVSAEAPTPTTMAAPAAPSPPDAGETADPGDIFQAGALSPPSDLTIDGLDQEQRSALFS